MFENLQLTDTPSSKVSTCSTLESDDGVSDFQISLLLQVCQHSGSEKHFALPHPKQIPVQLQCPDLNTVTQRL